MKKERDLNEMTIWGIHELMRAGFSRTMSYRLMHQQGVPVIQIGGRVFVERAKFLRWLEQQKPSTSSS